MMVEPCYRAEACSGQSPHCTCNHVLQPGSDQATNRTHWLSPTLRLAFFTLQGSNRSPGLVGLSNLGNTCYMNSSLQCLLHTVPLMRSFLSGAYRDDINRVNPLGQKGELAESFACLMASVWKSDVQYVAPRSFKAKIGRFCPVFTGYGQQDSQELLAFLLDGLHEDLNRIKQKPYLEGSDDDEQKRPDDEVAAAQWALHRSRNDSLIVDHCLGLYRSTLVCPRCNHTSRKFDPVMYLSLPLPESRQRSLTVTLIHVDGSQLPTKYMVEVPSVGTVKELLHALAKLAGIEVAPPSVVSSRVTSVAAQLDALGSGGSGGGAPTCSAGSSVGGAPATPAQGTGAAAEGPAAAAQPVRPQDVLLLARICQSHWSETVEVFTDTKTRVSEIVPNDRTYQPEFLVCYRYPSAQWGPGNKELIKVVVHHKRKRPGTQSMSRPFAAPLVLLLPKEVAEPQPEQLKAEKTSFDVEFTLTEEAPVVACVRQALLPFHTPAQADDQVPCGDEAAAQGQEAGVGSEAAAASAASESEGGAVAPDELAAGVETPSLQDISEGAGETGQSAAEGAGAGAAADLQDSEEAALEASSGRMVAEQGTAAVEETGMDWEASAAAAAAAVGGGDDGEKAAETSSGNGNSAAEGVPAVQPFNMWAAQEEGLTGVGPGVGTGAAEAAGAEASSAPQPAFTVQVCHAERMDRRFLRGEEDMTEVCSTHTFTVNWPDPAPVHAVGGSYNTAAMEQPLAHESWVRAEQQAAQGRRPVTLAACFEAFLQPEQLSEDDSWYCPKCKDHVEADKKLVSAERAGPGPSLLPLCGLCATGLLRLLACGSSALGTACNFAHIFFGQTILRHPFIPCVPAPHPTLLITCLPACVPARGLSLHPGPVDAARGAGGAPQALLLHTLTPREVVHTRRLPAGGPGPQPLPAAAPGCCANLRLLRSQQPFWRPGRWPLHSVLQDARLGPLVLL